jgi:serine protease Do
LGDLIVAIDGKKTESVNELYLILEQYKVGDTVSVAVQRAGKKQQLRAALEALG